MPDMTWPFEAVLDHNGYASTWVALHGPVVAPSQHARFAELRRRGTRFVGVTSYLDFPHADPCDGLDYEAVCEAWCHCFREPQRHFSQATPRALVSASDFTDWLRVERAASQAARSSGVDIVYVGASAQWQQPAKNWPLAARCLPRLCHELGLRALVIGRADKTFPPQPGITFSPPLEWPVLLAAVASARLLFVPNALDPSPRVIAEALCLDRPVLMQRDILGGWKYVNRYTGGFFDNEQDVVHVAAELLAVGMAPREWFRVNFGPEPSSRRLTALLRPLDDALGNDAALRISAAGPQGHRAA